MVQLLISLTVCSYLCQCSCYIFVYSNSIGQNIQHIHHEQTTNPSNNMCPKTADKMAAKILLWQLS